VGRYFSALAIDSQPGWTRNLGEEGKKDAEIGLQSTMHIHCRQPTSRLQCQSSKDLRQMRAASELYSVSRLEIRSDTI